MRLERRRRLYRRPSFALGDGEFPEHQQQHKLEHEHEHEHELGQRQRIGNRDLEHGRY